MSENTNANDRLQDSAPSLWAEDFIIDDNSACQLIRPADAYELCTIDDQLFIKVGKQKWKILDQDEVYEESKPALRLSYRRTGDEPIDFKNSSWVNSPKAANPDRVRESLKGNFKFIEEAPPVKGLRAPQIGALHAVIASWTVPVTQPVTVVMPTGTGKTETMLSFFGAERPQRLLVVVPSDALRKQLAGKFETYGILKNFNIIPADTPYPVVGKIEHAFDNEVNARGFAQACNVIVTTPNALRESSPEVWKALVKECSHLFIDEAHHIAAATWQEIRDEFIGKPVAQFTATPFREDGEAMGGKLIYAYPLKEAQKQGYFSKIKYHSVVDFDDIDRGIAIKAIECLKEDLDQGLDHLLMARTRTIKRAQELVELYEELEPALKPVAIYSQLKLADKKAALKAMETRSSRIIICVDMLGEGFDLPSLKVAAIHDIHKSLGVTLQFIGRFARVASSNIGEATAVVGRGDLHQDVRLRELYAEDADWNYIIQDLSAGAIGEQEELSEFEQGFNVQPEEISLQNLTPKMSTVVYRTTEGAWHPERLEDIFKEKLVTRPLPVNHNENIAWFVTKRPAAVPWGDVKYLEETLYELWVLYWDRRNRLLYINCSSNDGVFRNIAKAVCGDEIEIFKGSEVYKTMAALNRRIPTVAGLLDIRNKSSRFEMRAGSNVDEAFTEASRRNKTHTNIFAYGFDAKSGVRMSVGVSTKGRIWTQRIAASLKAWKNWCDYIGGQLIDPAINPETVLKDFITPEPLETRPDLIALGLEWSTETFLNTSEEVKLSIGGVEAPLIDVDLTVTSFTTAGPIPFQVSIPGADPISYELLMQEGEMQARAVSGEAIVVSRIRIPFSEYIKKIGLRVILEKEAVIEPSMFLVKPQDEAPAYPTNRLSVINWQGTNIRKEVPLEDSDSIQAKAKSYLEDVADWDVIINDDGSGEVADLVGIRVEGTKLKVNLMHCKASHTEAPGYRVEDLYELCGQAQKSIVHRHQTERMLRNLVRREKARRRRGQNGLIKGSEARLQELVDQCPLLQPDFTVTLVQPGVSKNLVSATQLELLGATESYIKDIGGSSNLEVIVSR